MAVILPERWEKDRPSWCKFSAYGLYKLAQGRKEEDYHFHDCDEYFIVTEGRAPVLLEGKEYEIAAWDCVCIPAGGMHQILTVKEDLTLVWLYDGLKGKKREGHIPAKKGKKKTPGVKIVKLGTWREQRPQWSRLADVGILEFPKGKVEMDYHFHDCHEYYFVTKGSFSVLVEDQELKVREGEVCPIRIGDRHKVLEALEDSAFIWLEDRLEREKRYGHLHYEEEGALPMAELPYRPAPPRSADHGIGVIGVGRIANHRQIPDYLKAGLKVAAICDTNEQNLESTRKRFGIEKAFTDYRRLLELKEVKIVDILTQSWVRPPMIRDAAKAGKHIICEKPFARSVKEAASYVKMAEDAGVMLAVHQPTRYYFPFALAKILVQKGYIGEPFFFIDDRCHYLDTGYYENPVTRWHVRLDDFIPMEWGAHPFDISRWLFGKEPARIYWSGTRMPFQNFGSEMAGACVADFEPPLKAAFVLHMADQSSEYYWHFRIEGKEGTIKGNIEATNEPPWLECCSKKLGGKWQRMEWSYGEAIDEVHGGPMFDLINSIVDKTEPPNSGRDNLGTIRFCEAVLRSGREKRIVELKNKLPSG